MTEIVRTARKDELVKILDLYRHLNPEDDYSDPGRFESAWEHIHAGSCSYYCLVSTDRNIFTSSCFLAIIPNLTRSCQPIGFIENVITHPDYRRKGHAARVLQAAVEMSWSRNCYKTVLLSGIKRTEAHRLYEKLGFSRNLKYGFEIRRD